MAQLATGLKAQAARFADGGTGRTLPTGGSTLTLPPGGSGQV
ncbi:hypothetical protein [Roseomonas sp. BN140053]